MTVRPAGDWPCVEAWQTRGPVGPGAIPADGCMDLVTDGTTVVVAGPDSRARWFAPAVPTVMWGARFRPGLLPAVLGVPACHLLDQIVPLEAVAPLRVAPEQLRDPQHLRRLAARGQEGSRAYEVARALALGRSVDAVAASTGWSPRQLRRLSAAWFGYGPKHLQRVLRLRRAEALIAQGSSTAWTAAECGYADSSHLWRDRRDLSPAPKGS